MNGYELSTKAELARILFMEKMGHTVCTDWSKVSEETRKAWEAVVLFISNKD